MRVLAAHLLVAATLLTSTAAGSELRMMLRSEPRNLNPLQVEEEFGEILRYLTTGGLVRMNRSTQQAEPALATSWSLSKDARQITLQLRKGVRFSDGSPFDSADVLHTFKTLFAPDFRSPVGDDFKIGGAPPVVQARGPFEVSITFQQPAASVTRLLDQLAILSSRAAQGKPAGLGPFDLAEHKAGAWFVLRRNPNYWKRDASGRQLPLIDSLRLSIQPNREIEALAFRRGEIDLIPSIDARTFDDLSKALPGQAVDIGASLDQEFFWFNQNPAAKIPAHKKEWFRSAAFRNAISRAINRADLCRIAYRGHAIPAVGPYPPVNKAFFNPGLRPHSYDVARAKKLLTEAGFTLGDGTLRDAANNPVVFTVMTNAGNRAREQMATLIQRDLKAIGIQMNLVTLDFQALIERMMRTSEYEATLLGLVDAGPDPNSQKNVWLSSGASHIWNPRQPKPATPWEAEIDRLMERVAAAVSEAEARKAFYRVQEIIDQQQPVIYLVHPNTMAAISPRVKNVRPASLRPHVLWNIDMLEMRAQ